jgi:hypothetical protein
MQAWLEAGSAAIQLLLVLIVAWFAVFLISGYVERRVSRRGGGGPGLLGVLGWLWEYSNVIGIPTLLLGAAFLIWSMNWGPGLSSGPALLAILLMSVAAFVVGFGPGLRRRSRP